MRRLTSLASKGHQRVGARRAQRRRKDAPAPTTVSTAASQPSREYNCAISLALIPGSRLGPDEILSALGDLGNRMTKTATRMRSVIRRTLFLFLFVAALSLVRMFAAGPGPRPGFDGIWNSATATPLERPLRWKDK